MVAAESMLDDSGQSEWSGALSVLLLLDRHLFTSAMMRKNERFKKEDSDGWRTRYPWLKVKKRRFCKKRSNAPKSGEKTTAGKKWKLSSFLHFFWGFGVGSKFELDTLPWNRDVLFTILSQTSFGRLSYWSRYQCTVWRLPCCYRRTFLTAMYIVDWLKIVISCQSFILADCDEVANASRWKNHQ
jgi:hypothetical protein